VRLVRTEFFSAGAGDRDAEEKAGRRNERSSPTRIPAACSFGWWLMVGAGLF
jgi:hypothetical protein